MIGTRTRLNCALGCPCFPAKSTAEVTCCLRIVLFKKALLISVAGIVCFFASPCPTHVVTRLVSPPHIHPSKTRKSSLASIRSIMASSGLTATSDVNKIEAPIGR